MMSVMRSSVPYEVTYRSSRRRTISGVIHSRACCAPMYTVAGFFPSFAFATPVVTRTAPMSWPFVVWPITRNSAMSGCAAACAMSSSSSPPSPLYVRNTPSAACSDRRCAAGCFSSSSVPVAASSATCSPLRMTCTSTCPAPRRSAPRRPRAGRRRGRRWRRGRSASTVPVYTDSWSSSPGGGGGTRDARRGGEPGEDQCGGGGDGELTEHAYSLVRDDVLAGVVPRHSGCSGLRQPEPCSSSRPLHGVVNPLRRSATIVARLADPLRRSDQARRVPTSTLGADLAVA